MSRPPTPGLYDVLECKACKDVFRSYKSTPREHCSVDCRMKTMADARPVWQCEACQVSFSVIGVKQRRYCSIACREVGKRLPSGQGLRNEAVATYRRHAFNRGLAWALTDADVDQLFAGDCHWCGAPPSNRRYRSRAHGAFVYSGIDRVDNDRAYEADNCVSCCQDCNFMKRDMTMEAFVAKAQAIAGRHACV